MQIKDVVEKTLIFLQFDYSNVEICIILIEITMHASSFQSNKTCLLNFVEFNFELLSHRLNNICRTGPAYYYTIRLLNLRLWVL